MFIYRKLTVEQTFQMGLLIIDEEQKRALRDLLDDFYGKDTYLVDIEVAQSKDGGWVQNVLVSTVEGRHVLPDLTLPAWRDFLAEDGLVFDPNDKEKDQLAAVGAYMVQQNLYLYYDLDPIEVEGLRIEAGLPTKLPELYVLEVDASTVSSGDEGEGRPLPAQPSPAFLQALGASMEAMDQLAEQALHLSTEVNQLYGETVRDHSPLDQMITQARLRHLYAVQHADEAAKYLAFMLRELSAQIPPQ